MVAVLDGRPWLLLAGTASIRGEESVHVGSLTDQIDETVLNLTSLVESVEPETAGAWVFRELRCYHPRVEDAEPIRANLQARFPGLERLETLRADLCRDDLLVEIEGVAV
jgi:chorismate lyase/3-hydroxybenzoate synthase